MNNGIEKSKSQAVCEARKLRILFVARDADKGLYCLQSLLDLGIQPVAVCTARLKNRKLRLVIRTILKQVYGNLMNCLRRLGWPVTRYRSMVELANANRIRCFKNVQINAPKTVESLRELDLDIIVIAGFNQILKKEVIGLPAIACINSHSSLLPKYRGPYPYVNILQHGEKFSGVTIHHVTEDIDAGDIILQREFTIAEGETIAGLIDKSIAVAGTALGEAILQIATSNAQRHPQDESKASYFSHNGERKL